MNNNLIVEINEKDVKGTALYMPNEKTIYLFNVVIPQGLLDTFRMPKSSILRYHTSIKKQISVRKTPDEKRLLAELKKFLKPTKSSKKDKK